MPVVTELEPDECRALLRAGVFGRVGLMTPDGPAIFPVNYLVAGDAVLVATDPRGVLARSADGVPVVLEVDHIDPERWHGWSVMAHGVGRVVAIDDYEPPLDAGRPVLLRPRSWAAGDRTAYLVLTWTRLTGRKVGAGWDCVATTPARWFLPE